MYFGRCIAVVLLVGCVAASYAQSYPSRPLRIIVPYPPGASTDYTARLMGQRLYEAWGLPVGGETRVGAGGIRRSW